MEKVKNEKQPNTKQCPKCGITNPGDAVFCGECGERLPKSDPSGKRPPKPSKKRPVASVLIIIALIVIVAIAGIAGYLLYTGKKSDVFTKDPKASNNDTIKPISLPNSNGVISTEKKKDTIIRDELPDSLIKWDKDHSVQNKK